MENRRILPLLVLEKSREVRTTTSEENAKIDEAIKRRKKFDEGKAKAQGVYKEKLKEEAMKRSYTIDEMTTATILKGHPQAQEIIDMLNKGKKKNESGEEFQDGSEDTIGAEGHEANLRGVDHKTGAAGHPGTSTKNASLEDGDLEKSDEDDEDAEKSVEGDVEKSDNLADNLPEEFEDEMEDDDTIPAESSKKSIDDFTVEFLVKTMGQEKADEFLKTVINPKYTTPGALRHPELSEKEKAANPLINRKVNPEALRALKNKLGTGAEKSEGESDLEKGESGQKQERAEWAKDKEEEEREHRKDDNDMSKKSWSMDFSKSILENMGLEKGSPSVSKKVSGGKATQISYGTKPETRFKHPKQTGEVRYEHNIKEGTVTKKESTGEKVKFKEGKPIDVSDEKKLKNASAGEDFDLHKALDDILEKKTSR